MLGEGARAGFELLGVEHRTVCYVEREAPAAAQLARLMEAGALDPAPVWSDLLTFDGPAWRGRVDGLIAGFPCQDISIAGRRAGLDGKRSGLFFNILDLADDCNAWFLFLENVSAIATATATAVDEAEGTLEERAAARVVGELADRGWNAEWITLSASDVGASHGRARWFCLAWRVADAGRVGAERQRDPGDVARQGREAEGQARERQRGGNALDGGRSGVFGETQLLDDAQRFEQPGQRIHARSRDAGPGASDADGAGAELAHAHGSRWAPAEPGCEVNPGRQPEQGCCPVAHANGAGRRTERIDQCPNADASQGNPAMANASQSRLPNAEQRSQPGQPLPHGWRTASELRGTPLFAPGPIDPRWAGFVAHRPDLAPAVEPGVRMLVDGMAYLVDESRAHQLRQVGNGVVPLQAAAALVELVRRAAA
ncbi:DNA cytosine methyltransferase [Acidovorax sp. SUPP2825]|uniref:DNA cytosine methyltransferase n=1 Tax=Acidovorax sp. SUPP2825 TaxID=2920879 RepID=UPI0024E143BF|nr:DNA cytosine methyltransferase [Acidovorax sp. SUPP2825]